MVRNGITVANGDALLDWLTSEQWGFSRDKKTSWRLVRALITGKAQAQFCPVCKTWFAAFKCSHQTYCSCRCANRRLNGNSN